MHGGKSSPGIIVKTILVVGLVKRASFIVSKITGSDGYSPSDSAFPGACIVVVIVVTVIPIILRLCLQWLIKNAINLIRCSSRMHSHGGLRRSSALTLNLFLRGGVEIHFDYEFQ
ncbi:hypothetical protein AWENTII_011559 [Aspergillus wentii]